MSFYKIAKATYRRVIPKAWQAAVWDHRENPFCKALINVKLALEQTGTHDEIYDAKYFSEVDVETTSSAKSMVDTMVSEYGPKSVIDVGCGTGVLLAAFRDSGVKGMGIEYALTAIEFCKRRGLEVVRFDLENDTPPPDWRADLAVSMEVAEHLPERCADSFVSLLAALADHVAITAATPGQGGTDHVNEQPREYWIEKFRQRGLVYDADRTARWQQEWLGNGVNGCFRNNLMLFDRTPG